MISGIKLNIKPYMKDVGLDDILSDLDLLRERLPEDSYTNHFGTIVRKRTYVGEKYITILVDYSKEDFGYIALNDLFNTISRALPDFVASFPYSEKILLLSYPNISYPYGNVLDRFIEELQRFVVFLFKTFGPEDKDKLVEMIRDYVSLCVEYPNN